MQAKLTHGAPNPLGQRLKQEMKKRGVTSARLATDAGVKTSFIYDIISGKSSNPSTIKLARVADSLGVSLSMLVDGGNLPESAAPQPATQPDSDKVQLAQLTVDFGQQTPAPAFTTDTPFAFSKNWLRHQLGKAPEQLRWLLVGGDGMEPTLYNRDTVLVDISQQTPTPPGIFVLYDGFGLVVKRLEAPANHSGSVRIVSDNPQYSIYEKSLDEIRILGRVVWFARTL